MADQDLYETFLAYCSFGDRGNGGLMDGAKFAKFARETKVKGKRVTATEVDITFARVGHGGRKITYAQFMEAMQHLATMRYPSAESPDAALAKLKALVAKTKSPKTGTATKADTSGVYGKLTNEGLYTGAHAARFADIPNADDALRRAEELEEEAREAFQKYDKNHNGTIEEDELTALLKNFGFDETHVHNEFEAAVGRSGKIGWDEFVSYYNKLKSRAHGRARRAHAKKKTRRGSASKHEEDSPAEPADSIETVFKRFCAFGAGHGTNPLMDNAKFVKFAKDTKLIHKRGRLTTTDCDLIFNKVKQKGKRKIGFAEFETALSMIASKMYPKQSSESAIEHVHDMVVAAGGPHSSGTKAKTKGVYGRMTDTSKYTGAHKQRFDASGHGRGAAGRRDNTGGVKDLSNITRSNLN